MTKSDILSHFAEEGPTEKQQQEADEFQPVYFLAKDKSGYAKCTRCGQDIRINGVKHLDRMPCEFCRYPGTVVHTWRYKGNWIENLRRNVLSYHLEKSIINPDIVLCKAVYSQYDIDKDSMQLKTTRFVEAWYAFVPGKGGYEVTWDMRWYNVNNFWTGGYYTRYTRCRETRKRCTGRHKAYTQRSRANRSVPVECPSIGEWRKITQGQQLQYVCDFYAAVLARSYDFIEIMDRIARWPLAMEQLGKVGLAPMLIHAIGNGYGIGNCLNMRGKNLEAMLKVKPSKQDMAYMRECSSITVITYQKWARLKKCKYGRNLSLKGFMTYVAYKVYNETMFREAVNHTTIEKIFCYLEKQNEKFPEIKSDLGLYTDYIGDCVKLNMDLDAKSVLFPGNLNLMHNNLNTQIEYKANEGLEVKYHERYPELLDSYSYQDDTYSIIVPDKVTDLIREGKVQHICVGSYMERVATGMTDVVYIRKNAAMDISFCTMEIREGKIIQVRAKHNEKPPADTMEFVEKFRREKLGKGA